MPLPDDLLAALEDWFPHRVLLIRDLRDVIVSAALYTSAYSNCWNQPEPLLREHLQLLRDKEQGIDGISVLSLLERLWANFDRGGFAAGVGQIAEQMFRLASSRHDYFVYRYEDLVAGRLSELGAYLRLSMDSNDSVDPEFGRVVRTKGSGGWRDWFTSDDVAFFRPLFSASLAHFGYDATDWTINPRAPLHPEHCSAYFLRVVNERRRAAGLQEIDA
ncbi:MAG: hypothetical protein WBG92_02395 [Thiohalocapsa sp.]